MPYNDQYRRPIAAIAVFGSDSYGTWVPADADLSLPELGGKFVGRLTAGGNIALIDGNNTGATILGWAHVSPHVPHSVKAGDEFLLVSNPDITLQLKVSDPTKIPNLKLGQTYGLKVVDGEQVIDLNVANTAHVVAIKDTDHPGHGMVRVKMINSKIIAI